MPKSEQETTAIALAKKHWHRYVGCSCKPKDVPEGRGFDLLCEHRHVEVKGTTHQRPAFRSMTKGEFDAARKDPLFELWLVSAIHNERGEFHIVKRDEILASAKLVIQWHLPLGKSRLVGFREEARKREKRK
jgi:hypothetical protein